MRRALSVISFVILFFVSSSTSVFSGAAKSPVHARNGMVVSSHYLASNVGLQILKDGGNAVDAAVATGLALEVVLPSAGNIGGGGFMIVYWKDGRVGAFDFREKAPAAATESMYVDRKGTYITDLNHRGFLSIGVPGTVAGFDLALKKFGSKSWKELTAPAMRLAEKGFPLSWGLAESFAAESTDFVKYPSSARIFLKSDSMVFKAGEVWKQPDLAKTLKRIQSKGRDGFYKGETAKRLAEFMKKNGGLITEADLAAYAAIERTPTHGSYRGYDVYSMCPPSSGGTALVEMLNILEGYDLKSLGHNSAAYLHLLTESMRRAYADRARYLGDPDFNPEIPLGRLTSKSYAEKLRASIDPKKASLSDPVRFNEASESPQTTHYSVVDKDGNAVVVTYTLEDSYGSRIVADGLGFLLNDEMGDFNAQPGRTDSTGTIGTSPNLVQGGKRMLSSMTPTIVTKGGVPYLLIGSPGGRTIMNTVLQIVLNVVDFGMNISEAITAGRIHHPWLPDTITIERNAVTIDTRRLLEGMGHRVRVHGSQGSAMGILIDPKTKLRLGAADPRASDGAAEGY
ncbi:MAG: gamma-glutamyltransferase [Bacteroidota bacterium]